MISAEPLMDKGYLFYLFCMAGMQININKNGNISNISKNKY